MDDIEFQKRSQLLPHLIEGESIESWLLRKKIIDNSLANSSNPIYRIDYIGILQESIYVASESEASRTVERLFKRVGLSLKLVNVYSGDVMSWHWDDSQE